jgi:diguanylate cyclase (GGDEF)-like protein
MNIKLSNAFDEYPNPFYIIKPIVVDDSSNDFVYIYVNNAFCVFLGKSRKELVGKKFSEVFGEGEPFWLKAFLHVAVDRQHLFLNNVSTVIGRNLYTELFHIKPDLCGCIIHDYEEVSDSIATTDLEQLKEKANSDFLTGFYNRYYLNDLKDEVVGKKNVGFTYIDINNLKEINDLYGHSAGDDLIIKVATYIRKLYKNSTLFRVGGDEFVVITYGQTKDKFYSTAKRARKIFSKENLAAIGFKFYDEVENLDTCIVDCDDLMYKHKKFMKNIQESLGALKSNAD